MQDSDRLCYGTWPRRCGDGESDINYYQRNNNIEYQNINGIVRCVEKFDNSNTVTAASGHSLGPISTHTNVHGIRYRLVNTGTLWFDIGTRLSFHFFC